VVVAEVQARTVPVFGTFVARTVANMTVELRARVEGFLEEVTFADGARVEKDQVLFRIERTRYEAEVERAKARLAKAESDLILAREQVSRVRAEADMQQALASLGKADQDVARFRPLAEQRAIPQQDLDTAISAQKAAQASVEAARAVLRNAEASTAAYIRETEAAVRSAGADVVEAELNLAYTTIASPIAGTIGSRQVDVGNLVGRGESTLLATVSASDPIRTQFSISEADYLRLLARVAAAAGPRDQAEFELILADGSTYPHRGRLRSVERTLDVTTGTLPIEAEFPNPDGLIRPGQFGRVRVVLDQIEDAVLVPQRAVKEMQGAKTVYVVAADDKVQLRSITVSDDRIGDSFIALTGVKAGERVIVEGIQKARPGQPVAPTTAPLSTEGAK
jgi:membrane fusion protein (multidrug efflux system)